MSHSPVIALLSNPKSSGNRAGLPGLRAFVAAHPNIFHYEVDDVGGVPAALRTIARLKPRVLVINGGDGTVQRALTELHHGDYFTEIPPVAVLPNGKTNLIANDLGAGGDALASLGQLVATIESGGAPDLVHRQLIALSDGRGNAPPVLGMFLGGAGLADMIMFCRHKVYPLGLPNWASHVLALVAITIGIVLGLRAAWLPRRQPSMRVSVLRQGRIEGAFAVLFVTTLEQVLYKVRSPANDHGGLKLMAIEQRTGPLFKSVVSLARGKLGKQAIAGLHFRDGDEIRIEGPHASVIFDGELFEAANGDPIVLKPTPPVSFVKLAA